MAKIVAIFIMAKDNIQAEELDVQAVEVAETEVAETEVAETTTDVAEETAEEVAEEAENDIFAQFMSGDSSEDKDKEDVIRELLASGKAKLVKNLTVRNVVFTEMNQHTLLTFVVKEFVIGDTRSEETDAFDQPIIKLGKTHNVQSSSYAVASVMKDTPKLAIFATDVVNRPAIANSLFAGAKIDVLMEYVPKDVEYTNPFSTKTKPSKFKTDKMIHHIVRLELGEVGQDMYNAHLLR